MDRAEIPVLTTGANFGIGKAIALHAAELGFRSIGTVRSEEKAEIVHRAAREAGVEVETARLDVTDADACREVIERYEPLGLVNNAGYNSTGAIEDLDDSDARLCMETMAIAPLRLARLALPAMRSAGWGRIVQLSSIMGRTTLPLCGWYQASKHALEAASDALRVELAGSGVAVVLIEPGGVKTGIWSEGVWAHNADGGPYNGSPFTDSYMRLRRLTGLHHRFMASPERVARVAGKALAEKHPRGRYLIGADAHGLALIRRLFPRAVEDRLVGRGLGLR